MSQAARTTAIFTGPHGARTAPLQFVSPKAPESFSKAGRRRAQPEISWTFVPRLEPGDYPAYSRSAAVYRDRQFKRWVCAVQFNIMSSSLLDVIARLTWYLNLGAWEKPHAGRRGNYWAAWVRANGGPPKRNDRLSPRVFEGRYSLVRVADTTKTHCEGTGNPQESYSVIRNVTRRESGGLSR
jgi:hypothetical protein